MNDQVLQFKITLKEIQPPIWRRILVPSSYNFWDLHVAIQDSMDWADTHLHQFEIGEPRLRAVARIGVPDDEFGDSETLPGWEVALTAYIKEVGTKIGYMYDFGDGWEHEVLLEKVEPAQPGVAYPTCVGGKRNCPPDDIGGPSGYEDLLEALRDPKHDMHREMMEFVGESFDPEEFSPSEVEFDDPKARLRMAMGS